jgi:hypothetical protein
MKCFVPSVQTAEHVSVSTVSFLQRRVRTKVSVEMGSVTLSVTCLVQKHVVGLSCFKTCSWLISYTYLLCIQFRIYAVHVTLQTNTNIIQNKTEDRYITGSTIITLLVQQVTPKNDSQELVALHVFLLKCIEVTGCGNAAYWSKRLLTHYQICATSSWGVREPPFPLC